MYTITVTSDKIKSIIYYNLEQNCSKLPKKVTSTIQALSETLNTLINEEVLDKTLKSAVNGIYNEIIASLEKEKEQ
jgi:DNA-binding HxlR family transcriptional regulator